jgi:gluconate 2-dehydrogenase gamma chain
MVNRREFLAAGAALAASCTACRRTGYGYLKETDAATLTVLCDQIIPADDFPSASQAGVLNYIDLQLAGPYRRHQKTYREGLKQANAVSRTRFGVDLAQASAQQQFEVVSALEKDSKPFFELVRAHTMQGYYGSPRHGGNRDAVSWRMLGLDEPPLRGRAQYDFNSETKR